VLAGSLRDQYQALLPGFRFTTQYGGSAEDLFLDEGQVVFTTIDQTLSGFIGAPLSVPTRLANVLYGSVLSGALVFDEFHLLEPEKSFDTTLHLLRKSPWPVLVMTATVSEALREELCRALGAEPIVVEEEDLPHIRSQHATTKHLHVRDAPMDGARLADLLGTRTLVICNTVKRAQKVYRDLCRALDRVGDGRHRMLLHSRFLTHDRATKERALRSWFREGATDPAVLVATQVIEAGLDISCDVMHTEISPIDSFLQRIGRAARFSGEHQARIYVHPLAEMEKAGGFLPYMPEPTLATWERLKVQSALTYPDLQPLIDAVLTDSQQRLVRSYEERAPHLERDIHRVRWNVERSANRELIRHVDNADVVIADPGAVERLHISPYAWQAVGIPVGTVQSYLRSGGAAHVVQEDTDDPGETGRQGGRLFSIVPLDPNNPPSAWDTLRLIVHPTRAAYDSELGLRLGEAGSTSFEPVPEAAARLRYEYEEEPYREHIERLYQQRAAQQAPLSALTRLSGSGSPVRNPERLLDLVIWTHDLAKLADGWQQAHGDRDLNRPGAEPLAHGGRLHGIRPPPHAAESAFTAATLLAKLLAEEGESREVWACAMAAVRTHHSPKTRTHGPYRIRRERQEYLRRVTLTLAPALASAILSAMDANLVRWESRGDEQFTQPEAGAAFDPVYALLVYALRRSDQLATAEVSSAVGVPRAPVTGVSHVR
jgi:CRISPR-associated endonuclease/helicase Cas3